MRGARWSGSGAGRSRTRRSTGSATVVAVALATALFAVPVLWGPTPLSAQDAGEIDPEEEGRRLREAAGLEWRGQTDAAEGVLMELLNRWPTSSGGLFSLERILRSRSRTALVLPFADRYLDADPTASGVRYLKLRVLVEIDSLSALDPVAREWFEAEPESPDPYREVARLYARAFDDEAALEVLETGRERLADGGDAGALAMEIGDLRSRLGDAPGAIAEWSRAVRRPDAEVGLILRRLDRLGEVGPEGVEPLLASLTEEPATAEMRATAVRIALQLGMEARARALAEASLPQLDTPGRIDFLADLAQRADEAGLGALQLWALSEQRDRMGSRDARALDVRIASAALAAGDTATALEAQTRLARALPPGSVERRRVIADLLRVEAGTASVQTLRTRLSGFVAEFPDAPELDELTAVVSAAVAARGDREAALALLEGRTGPRTNLERAYLYFADAEVERGSAALDQALPALSPADATEGIQLIALLDRVQPASAPLLAVAAARAHYGDRAGAALELAEAFARVPEEDRAALLAQAARWGEEAGLVEEAAGWLAAIVTSWTEAPEHPEAIYRLARIRADQSRGLAEARALLQQLILERPNSPVVPAARRELQRIGRGTP